MRILALETDIEELKRKFLMEDEKAALVTHRHFFAFVTRIWWQTLVTVVVIAINIFIIVQGWWDLYLTGPFLLTWFIAYAYFLMVAYIDWKFNFIIVTTQKVVLVEQKSFFHQQINPLNYEQISNTRVQSQFGGFFHCGIVYLNTKTPERGGMYMELPYPYIPSPEDVAAVIEHGITIFRQPMKQLEEQEKKDLMQKPVISAENPEPDKLPDQQSAAPATNPPHPEQ